MLREQTFDKLSRMKMHGFAAAFREQLENESRFDTMAFEDRVALLIDHEWTEREARRLTRRLGVAKLRVQAAVEDIDYRHPRGLDRTLMTRLAACEWVRDRHNVILEGKTGLGKTWLACALAHKACRDGYTAMYRRVPRFFGELAMARADGSYGRLLTRISRVDVLVLDDWGLAPLNDRERRDLMEVIEDRTGTRSTIVATQVPVAEWHKLIGGPTVADAIMDRLVHAAHRIKLDGESMRKAKARIPDAPGEQ